MKSKYFDMATNGKAWKHPSQKQRARVWTDWVPWVTCVCHLTYKMGEGSQWQPKVEAGEVPRETVAHTAEGLGKKISRNHLAPWSRTKPPPSPLPSPTSLPALPSFVPSPPSGRRIRRERVPLQELTDKCLERKQRHRVEWIQIIPKDVAFYSVHFGGSHFPL